MLVVPVLSPDGYEVIYFPPTEMRLAMPGYSLPTSEGPHDLRFLTTEGWVAPF